ncbi:hypothetical protein D3C86_1519620 [compost metagenome]
MSGLTQLLQEEFAVIVIQHANPFHLGQEDPGQAQLAIQRRITPEQAQARGQGVAQVLPCLQAADAQYQGCRALAVLQAPVEAWQIEQDQADIRRQFARRRQFGQRLKTHVVRGPQFAQCLDEGLHAGAVFGASQQNVRGIGRKAA